MLIDRFLKENISGPNTTTFNISKLRSEQILRGDKNWSYNSVKIKAVPN